MTCAFEMLKPIEIFVCQICTEPYDNGNHEAKFLSCHHSYCMSCLTNVVKNKDAIVCPCCRKETQLPPAGVAALQSNFYISKMQDVLKDNTTPKLRGCKKHHYQPTSFYCKKCEKAICRDCTVLDHREDAGHIIQDFEAGKEEQREQLNAQLRLSQKILQDAQTRLDQLEQESDMVPSSTDATIKQIEAAFQRFASALESRKVELLDELKMKCREKQDRIEGEIKTINPKLANFKKVLNNANQLIRHGSLAEMIRVKASLKQLGDELRGVMNGLAYNSENVLFDEEHSREDFERAVGSLGRVCLDETIPTRGEISVPELTASIPATGTIRVYSSSGMPLVDGGIDVVLRDSQGDVVEKRLSWHDGHGSFTFIPQTSGTMDFCLLYHDRFIQGTYKAVDVKSNDPVAKFGGVGDGHGKFNSPRAIAVGRDGQLYVADTGNSLIQKFDADGRFVDQFDISNGNPDSSTCDLALFGDDGLLACTETVVGKQNNPQVANTVLVYADDGQLRERFSNEAMKCALCIATNRHGEIILSDYRCHGLFVHDRAGGFLRKIGNQGTFNHPAFICVTDDDCIIVSDTNTHAIHVYNREGRFLRQFGKAGRKKGEMKQPFGVACDGEHILVVDSGNSRINVFDMDGAFVSTIESRGDPMNQPRGMAITQDGYVYVADRDNHCIKKYRYK